MSRHESQPKGKACDGSDVFEANSAPHIGVSADHHGSLAPFRIVVVRPSAKTGSPEADPAIFGVVCPCRIKRVWPQALARRDPGPRLSLGGLIVIERTGPSTITDHRSPIIITSIGGAEWRAGESFRDCYARMDRALYLAKSSGRDQVRSENELEWSESSITLSAVA